MGQRIGKPEAYILGEWDFYDLTLEITPDVLIPRPETEILAELAIKRASGRALDLCCGSGCIGLAVAKHCPEVQVVLADISPKALKVTERNANEFSNVTVVQADVFKPNELGQFDMIVCNPPYVTDAEYEELDSSVKDYEPEIALRGGSDGMDFYRAIAKYWDAPMILLEVGWKQARDVAGMFKGREVEILKDYSGIERIVIARK